MTNILRKMSLATLKIRNFKGVESLEINANSGNISIFGANGTCKTTIGDAVSWLLFNKDSSGSSKFEVKPLDSNGENKHKVESEVIGLFTYGYGSDVVLRKVFKEKWARVRGAVAKEMTGHCAIFNI